MSLPQFDPYSRTCPSRRFLNEIGELWTVLIVGALADGPLRFKDLNAQVDGISYRMLTQTLRTLERDGLVTRTQYPESPPRVVYELTEAGRELVAPLQALAAWATDHMADVLQARARFDEAGRTR